MKKCKKILILALILFISICMENTVDAALSCDVTMQTSKIQYSSDEEIIVEVKVSNIQTDNGIIAFQATLEYNEDDLSLEKIEGLNGWDRPVYNEGELITEREDVSKADETIMKLTFKAKTTIEKDVTISLINVKVANGVDSLFKTSCEAKTVTINKVENSSNNTDVDNTGNNNVDNTDNDNTNNTDNNNISNNNNNNINNNNIDNNNINSSDNSSNNTTENVSNTTNSTNTDNTTNNISNSSNIIDNSTASGKLPETGNINIILLILITIFIICAIVVFIKLKTIKKENK